MRRRWETPFGRSWRHPNERHSTHGLAYAGALPFWLLLLAPETVADLNTASLFVAYGAIISTFIAGTLWGHAQVSGSDLVVIVASNVFALISFATVVFKMWPIALVVQLVIFGLLLIADYDIYAGDSEQRWYWRLRLRVTLLVSFAYDVMLLNYTLNVCN